MENKVENLDDIVKNAYNIACERDLKIIGAKYKKYYEDVLNNFR